MNLNLKKWWRALAITIELEELTDRREISGVVFFATYLGREDRHGCYGVIIKPWIALAQS